MPDTEVVRDWLTRALDAAAKGGASRADLARHCKVTPQAVTGWLRTGRISKRNLERATGFFGHGPSFTHSGILAIDQKRGELPPPPASDFADRDTPTESDWQLLRDLKWIPEDERDALRSSIHERATKQREHTLALIEQINRKRLNNS